MFLVPERRYQSWKVGRDAKTQLLEQSRRSNIHLGERRPVFESSTKASFAGLHGVYGGSPLSARAAAHDSIVFIEGGTDSDGRLARRQAKAALRPSPPSPPTPTSKHVGSHIVFGTEPAGWYTEARQHFVPKRVTTASGAHLHPMSRLVLGYQPAEWRSSTMEHFARLPLSARAVTTVPTTTSVTPGRPHHLPITELSGPDHWLTMNGVCEALAPSRSVRQAVPIRPKDAIASDMGGGDDRDFRTATGSFYGWRSGLQDPVRPERGRHDCRIMFGDDALDYHTMSQQSSALPTVMGAKSAPARIRPLGESHAVGGGCRRSPTDYETTFERDYRQPSRSEPPRPVTKPGALTLHDVIAHNEESAQDHFLSTAAATFDDKMHRVKGPERKAVLKIATLTKQRFARASWPADSAHLDSYETEISSQFTAKPATTTTAAALRSGRGRSSPPAAVINTDHLQQWAGTTAAGAGESMSVTASLLNSTGHVLPMTMIKAPMEDSHVLGHGLTAPMSLTTSSIMSSSYADQEM